MTNKEILEKIYRENKSINRNLHCLINIGCIEFIDYRKEIFNNTEV